MYYLLCVLPALCAFLLGLSCTRCPPFCLLHTSSVWYLHWKHTPTSMTSMLEMDRVRFTKFIYFFLTLNSSRYRCHVFSIYLFAQCPFTTGQLSTGRGGGLCSSSSEPLRSRRRALTLWLNTSNQSSISPTSHRCVHRCEHAHSVASSSCVILLYIFLQYFLGVTVLAMVPEIPEIVNGIQFALQNNISLR